MNYLFVRTHQDKRGKPVTIAYDIPSKDVADCIADSISARHVSQVDGLSSFVEGLAAGKKSNDVFKLHRYVDDGYVIGYAAA